MYKKASTHLTTGPHEKLVIEVDSHTRTFLTVLGVTRTTVSGISCCTIEILAFISDIVILISIPVIACFIPIFLSAVGVAAKARAEKYLKVLNK